MPISKDSTTIAFFGLGQMGGPMAGHLAKAGYRVIAHDLRPEAVAALVEAGAEAAASAEQAIADATIVMTCLPTSPSLQKFAEDVLLPNAREGLLFVDHGTTHVPFTKDMANRMADLGAEWVDAPISGGALGAQKAALRIWGGGSEQTFEALRPLFECYGQTDAITHIGPSGHGQIAKGVHQLKEGLQWAARLEAISFAYHAGADMARVRESFRGADPRLEKAMDQILEGEPSPGDPKSYEYPYWLAEATASGFRMPLMETIMDLVKDEPRDYEDSVHRPIPSVWLALTKAKR